MYVCMCISASLQVSCSTLLVQTKEVRLGGGFLTPMSWSSNLIFDQLFWATSLPPAGKHITTLTQINAQ